MPNAEYYQKFVDGKQSYFASEVQPRDVPAPIGGWDAFSPLTHMPPDHAVTLQNWIPRPGWVELRGGYNVWTSITQTAVNSLLVYRPVGGTERMFAVSNNTVYETSSFGVIGNTPKTVTNTYVQYVNFTVPGGSSYLVCCNGVDAPFAFDGTNWTTPSIGLSSGLSGYTLNPNKFIQVLSHQQRLFFVLNNSTQVWYFPVQSISAPAGANGANVIDVGSFVDKGSYVVSITSLTLDGGNGPNAFLVIATNKGQIVIYQGTDPTNANAWSLVGTYDLPPPLGTRCFRKIGSDVAYLSTQGLIPLSKALPFNPAAQRSVAFTLSIQNTMLLSAQTYAANQGWETTLFDQQGLMIVNIPVTTNNYQQQYVMNLLTGKWCQFTGWYANTFAIFNENLFFGDNTGNVNMAYTGRTDFSNAISADMKCAFNFFEAPGRLKNMTMVKPYMIVDGFFTPTFNVNVDFGDVSPTAPVINTQPTGALWDSALWDSGLWSGGNNVSALWQNVNALGTALAVRMKVNYGGTTGSNLAAIGVFDSGVFDTTVFDGTGVTVPGSNLPVIQVLGFEAIVQPGGPV